MRVVTAGSDSTNSTINIHEPRSRRMRSLLYNSLRIVPAESSAPRPSVPPATDSAMRDEAEIAKRYFGSFADDYHRAFEGKGQNPLHALINSLFRRKTFVKRTDVVRDWLASFNVNGKHVLELGCG